ncbi:hypothetical protein [Streptomyces sp. NPDC051109]|uniref:hypothetical protein n=1 Tax=Streptomyces sp. NPDC051109 TaxID=3365642 RepID=UPI0037873503
MRAPFRFPEDLLALERARLTAYADLAQAPAAAGTTALRRRLITLSGYLHAHPYWTAHPGRRPDIELRRAALGRARNGREGA